jgi:hypothetical protein
MFQNKSIDGKKRRKEGKNQANQKIGIERTRTRSQIEEENWGERGESS